VEGDLGKWVSAVLTTLIALSFGAVPLEAKTRVPSPADLEHLAQEPIAMELRSLGTGSNAAAGSDLAFQGDLLVAGAYEGVGLFRMLAREPYVKQLSFFHCPGAQGDVSIWGDYVFISVEHQSSYNGTPNAWASKTCNTTGVGFGMEGIRIIDISDPRVPHQVSFIPIVCGSHTHTLVPDGDTMYIYNSALPPPSGDVASHCSRLTIVSFPTDDPTQAAVIAEPSMDLEIGCHDITVFPAKGLAAAACWTDSYLWDIEDPADPKVVSQLPSDWVDGHHAAAFTWDGRYVAVGQEAGDCTTREGEIVFYDIRDPAKPSKVGRFHLPRPVSGSFCWAHNFATVPTKDPSRYVLTAGFYNGGMSIIDFSTPRKPTEIAFSVVDGGGVLPQPWGAYWYNGRVYTNDWTSGLGVGVYRMKGLGAADATSFGERLNPQVQIRG
jgi:hypothetical protein